MNERLSDILSRFDEGFSTITKQTVTVTTQVFPNASAMALQEQIDSITAATDVASKERYLTSNDHEAILARLIMQIYAATNKFDQVANESDEVFQKSESFFEILTNSKETDLEKIFDGFEFYENNPYREIAEKRLAKIYKKRNR